MTYHGTENFHNGPILSFSNTILFGSIQSGGLPLNANFLAIVIEFIRLILGSIIGPQNFDLLPCLIFNQGLEGRKPFECFVLFLQKVYPSLAGEVIYESDII